MKRLYLSIFSIIISSFAILAQDVMYFKEGSQWIVEIYPDEPYKPYVTETLTLQSIPGATSNILALYTDHPSEYYFDAHCLNIMVEGEKVYFQLVSEACVVPSADDEGWYLMYDFGLEVGESCEIYNAGSMRYNNDLAVCKETIKCIGYTGTDEIGSLCHMNMEELHSGERGVWIKGVGDSAGLLDNGGYGRDGRGSKLIKFIFDGEEIYSSSSASVKNVTDSQDFQVIKNGLNLTVLTSDLGHKCYVYSLDGKLISINDLIETNKFSLPSPGFYILKIGNLTKTILLTEE